MKKKLLTALLLVAASTFWTNTLYAVEYESSEVHTITGLYVMATRPGSPQYSHMIFFTLSDMNWIPSTCSKTLIALPDTEKILAATLMSANLAKKPVKVYIDDSLKTGGYCHAVIIYAE